MVSWANHHYTQFALTWVHHVQALNITGYMMGAMDDEILAILAKRKINTFSMKAGKCCLYTMGIVLGNWVRLPPSALAKDNRVSFSRHSRLLSAPIHWDIAEAMVEPARRENDFAVVTAVSCWMI